MSRKAMLGGRVRALRKARNLSQADLARQLGISASYLNLIEHNQRPVTVPVLLKLSDALGADVSAFTTGDDARLAGELAEVFGDALLAAHDVQPAELRELAVSQPAVARAVLALYRAWRSAQADNVLLAEKMFSEQQQRPGGLAGLKPPPEEEVSDFLQAHLNHFPELEAAAERLWEQAGLSRGEIDRHLVEHLQAQHDVRVDVVPSRQAAGMVRRYDPQVRRLQLSEVLAPRSRSFQLAHQIALLGCRPEIERLVAGGQLTTPDSQALARVALANTFAGAVLMPYARFLAAAREVRYDVELLGHRFRTSFEQVCHRLTTLQRPGEWGVPFHMVRVDIAGNISKRFSASGIRFARYGGSCPRWNVHAAFLAPGFIRTQVSRMPDGTRYFCIARTVRKEGGGFHVPQSRLAIGLGCEIGHARELVYADGYDLENEDADVPIGTTCRLCERNDCRQRAFPPLQHPFTVDENVRGLSFYASPAWPDEPPGAPNAPGRMS
ncbi:MAG: ImmA/IrrE family metallo-endopeptidase [Planctomycetes bacterium]|nr:ImmA/IrrE family metallo-endopeptidase [Planctomycetota bacterium]